MNTKTIQKLVSLPVWMLDEIRTESEKMGMTANEFIRVAIRGELSKLLHRSETYLEKYDQGLSTERGKLVR